MTNKEEYDRYAVELTRRLEALTDWAIANWPRKDRPLLQSDFAGARRDLAHILGSKLDDATILQQSAADGGNVGQYVDVTPMPWP